MQCLAFVFPLSQLPQGHQTFARYTPMYGVRAALARAPLVGGATAWAAGSVVLWTVLWVWCDDDVSAGYDAGVSVAAACAEAVSAVT